MKNSKIIKMCLKASVLIWLVDLSGADKPDQLNSFFQMMEMDSAYAQTSGEEAACFASTTEIPSTQWCDEAPPPQPCCSQ